MLQRVVQSLLLVSLLAGVGGCASLVAEGGSAGAGIVSGSLTSALSDSAGAAAGIGIGVQAATRSGIAAGQRKIHGNAQQNIADIAGPLPIGEVQLWRVDHPIPLEPSQAGRVTVSRVISTGTARLQGDRVFGRRERREETADQRVLRRVDLPERDAWSWASAEPATARWGALQ